MRFSLILGTIVLVSAANAAPVLAKRMLGTRLETPIDGGLLLGDGRRLLGGSKTWRGLIAACLLPAVLSPLMGLPVAAGAVVGAAAMIGDCASSFVKRRMGLAPSDKATGIDQIPEALLPAVALWVYLPLGWGDIVAVVIIFFVLEIVMSRLFFMVGLRDRPY